MCPIEELRFVALTAEEGMLQVGNHNSIKLLGHGILKIAPLAHVRTHIVHLPSVLYSLQLECIRISLSQAPKKNFKEAIDDDGNEHRQSLMELLCKVSNTLR